MYAECLGCSFCSRFFLSVYISELLDFGCCQQRAVNREGNPSCIHSPQEEGIDLYPIVVFEWYLFAACLHYRFWKDRKSVV